MTDEERARITKLEERVADMEINAARQDQKLDGLTEKVSTGFLDLKDVIVAQREESEKREQRRHELAVKAAEDRKALSMKILTLVGAAISILAASAGGVYSMTAANDSPPPVAAEP